MSELTLPFQRILITGGAGFIGSALVRHLIRYTQATVINVDALTYAGNPESLAECRGDPRHQFEHCDIRNASQLAAVFHRHRPEAVIHLAAESHVDRSIAGPAECVETNVMGTQNLLETARHYWQELEGAERSAFRLHHVSTDEVFGDLGPTDPPFSETMAFQPSSPYSASKAASNHLVNAWHRTYGLPTLITNCSNNYGPYQFPEKLIPLMVTNALEDRPLPVYGDGSNIRDWLHVDDHVQALCEVLAKGEAGRSYNIGGHSERTNLEVVSTICDHLDELRPERSRPHRELIRMVTDRPGHDRRYAIDDSRIRSELGWRPRETFESGLRRTVEWYLNHRHWVDRVRSGAYREYIRTLANDPAAQS